MEAQASSMKIVRLSFFNCRVVDDHALSSRFGSETLGSPTPVPQPSTDPPHTAEAKPNPKHKASKAKIT